MPEDDDVETMEVSDVDAAFVLGKHGRTKHKIMRVTDCDIELISEAGEEGAGLLQFTGTDEQRRKAQKYCRCIMAQRDGDVEVEAADVKEDCTVVKVPKEAAGFVMGKGANFLRMLEDENKVIAFYAKIQGSEDDEHESLLIFGDRRGRRSAQLSVLRCVETKMPGYYTKAAREKQEYYEMKSDLTGDWGTETMELEENEVSWAFGKKGATMMKIGRAAECIVHYVTRLVFFSGTKKQRARAKEYLGWVLKQLDKNYRVDTEGRNDCTVLQIPNDCVGYVMGGNREALTSLEEMAGVMAFFMGATDEQNDNPTETLAIFGPERCRRHAELDVMSSVEKKNEGFFTKDEVDHESPKKGFDTDRVIIEGDDLSYCLGKQGNTRKKIANASGAILVFVGQVGYIAGTLEERLRCRDYLDWLLTQKDGQDPEIDIEGRTDVTQVSVHDKTLDLIDRFSFKEVERETGTWCFISPDADGNPRLLICGHEEGKRFGLTGRLAAERMCKDMFRQMRDGNYTKGSGKDRGGKNGGDSRGGRYDDDNRRDDNRRDDNRRDDNRRDDNRRGGGKSGRSNDDNRWGGGHDSWSNGDKSSNRRDSWSGGRDNWSGARDDHRGSDSHRGRGRSRTPPRSKGGRGGKGSDRWDDRPRTPPRKNNRQNDRWEEDNRGRGRDRWEETRGRDADDKWSGRSSGKASGARSNHASSAAPRASNKRTRSSTPPWRKR